MNVKYLPICQYGVADKHSNDVVDCGEPAVAAVWWREDASDVMYVCAKHLEMMEIAELQEGY